MAAGTPLWSAQGLGKLFEALPVRVKVIAHPDLVFTKGDQGFGKIINIAGIYAKVPSPEELTFDSPDGEKIVLVYRLTSENSQAIGLVHRKEGELTWWIGTFSGGTWRELFNVSGKATNNVCTSKVLRGARFGWKPVSGTHQLQWLYMFEPTQVPSPLETLLKLKLNAEEYVKVAGRDAYLSDVKLIEQGIIEQMTRHEQDVEALESCVEGCNSIVFSDISLEVANDVVVPANRHMFMSKSPVFEAMLAQRDEGVQMKEASSGRVKLEHASEIVVKSIVSLLHTEGRSLVLLQLGAADLLDVINQIAEWQCTSLVAPLLQQACRKIAETDASVAAHALQLADKHMTVAVHDMGSWRKLYDVSLKQLAVVGNFDILEDLPFRAVLDAMCRDDLETGKCEGKVLKLAVNWVKKRPNHHDKMTHLIKAVRFPLIPAANFCKAYQAEFAFVKECGAGDLLNELQGEAIHTQLQRKHKRKGHRDDHGDDEWRRRARVRTNSGEPPELSHSEIAKAVMMSPGA